MNTSFVVFSSLIPVLGAAAPPEGSLADAPTRARSVKTGAFISWREHRIDDEGLSGVPIRGADGLALADLDRDGHLDIVSVHEDSSHVRIAFGSEDPDRWTNVTMAAGERVGAVEDVAIGDLDGDGRLDCVFACENAHLIYFKGPADPRDPAAWKFLIPPITKNRGSWIRVQLADIAGDERPEVFAPNKGDRSFSIFHLTGDPLDSASWTEYVLGTGAKPINIRPIDIDGDSDLDVITASRQSNEIFLYENLGRRAKGIPNWKRHEVHTGPPASEGFMIDFADLDGDGRTDLVTEADHAGDAYWFRQPATLGPPWRNYRIGSVRPDYATALKLIDLNDDGRLDLFVGGYSGGPRLREPAKVSPTDVCGRLAWFARPADPTKPWKRYDVSRRRRAMYDMFWPIDLNGDGLTDFVTTRGNSGNLDGVLWLEQVRSDAPVRSFTSAHENDSRQVPLPR